MAMKLDISKAYDPVDWRYLRWMMMKMNFPSQLVELTLKCVESVSFRVLLNDTPTCPFVPSRGLRQGDLLSPFLFVICIEGFSTLLRKATKDGMIKRLKIGREAPEMTHLFFADDSLLLIQVEKEVDMEIKKKYSPCLRLLWGKR